METVVNLCWVYFCREFDGIALDYSRQRSTLDTMDKLFKLAEVGGFLYYHSRGLGISSGLGNGIYEFRG